MRTSSEYVLFWGDEPFSNFTPCRIEIQGKVFNSSEQLFMYRKAIFFKDYKIAEKILESKTPKEAKALGRKVKNFNEAAWTAISYSIMKDTVRRKFDQNTWMRQELLAPCYQNKTFVEASPYDRIWGIGFGQNQAVFHKKDWGNNRLGQILTELRDEYARNKTSKEETVNANTTGVVG